MKEYFDQVPRPHHVVPPSPAQIISAGPFNRIRIFESPVSAQKTLKEVALDPPFKTAQSFAIAIEKLIHQIDPDQVIHIGQTKITVPFLKTLAEKFSDNQAELTVTKKGSQARLLNIHPLVFILAGKLLGENVQLDGQKAREDAVKLMQIVEKGTLETSLEEINPESKLILTNGDLDKAMDSVSRCSLSETEFVEELADIFEVAQQGITITAQSQKDLGGFEVSEEILGCLEKLKYPESADTLRGWILNKLPTDEVGECILFLQTLVKFTTFIDSMAYLELFSIGKDQIPLLPFRSLHNGIKSAMTELKRIGANDYLPVLEDIEQLILLRFHQIFRGEYSDSQTANNTEALKPSIADLALLFASKAKKDYTDKGVPFKVSAKKAVKFLEQSGLTEIECEEFCNQLSVVDEDLDITNAVYKEAVLAGLIRNGEDARKIIINEIKRTAEKLKSAPYKGVEAANIDFSEVIDADTETVYFYILTGSVAPATFGHEILTESAIAYGEKRQQKDKSLGIKSQFFVLWAPLVKIEGMAAPHKPPAELGRTSERVASLLLMLTSLNRQDRSKVLVTTMLQPKTEQTPNMVKNLRAFVNKTAAKVTSTINANGRLHDGNIRFVLFCGSDEPEWVNTNKAYGEKRISTRQPGKFKKEEKHTSVIVSRQGNIVNLIRSGPQIKHTNIESIVITAGTRKPGSGETREQIRAYDTSSLRPQWISFYRHWQTSPTSGWSDNSTLSVESISRALYAEYSKGVNQI